VSRTFGGSIRSGTVHRSAPHSRTTATPRRLWPGSDTWRSRPNGSSAWRPPRRRPTPGAAPAPCGTETVGAYEQDGERRCEAHPGQFGKECPGSGALTLKQKEEKKKSVRDNVWKGDNEAREAPLVFTRASVVSSERIEKLFDGRLIRGHLGLLVGPGEAGKGMTLVFIVARLTTGEPFPGEKTGRPPMTVIICVTEDSKGRVRNRLEAAGADLDRVHFAEGQPELRGGLLMPSPVMLGEDGAKLVAGARELGAGALFLETTVEHLGDRAGTRWSSNNEVEVRRVLSPVRTVCEKAHLIGMGVMHPRKSMEGGIEDSISGSAAFRNVARLVLNVYSDPLDKSRNPVRLLCTQKNNHLRRGLPGWDTLRFTIEPWERDPDEGRAVFSEHHDPRTADQIWNQIRDSKKVRRDYAVMGAETLLREFLASGPKTEKEVRAAAEKRGVTRASVDRAKERLGVESVKETETFDGAWRWRLPEEM